MVKNIIVKCIPVVLLGIMSSCNLNAQVEKLPSQTFNEQIKATTNAQVLDVRTPAEFQSGHLTNAKNINWNDDNFEQQVQVLDKSKPVFVYCKGGGRSEEAAKKLESMGFTAVKELKGGILAWQNDKLAVEKEITDVVVDPGMSLENYNALVNIDKLVFVDFYAEWCGPCKKMKPYLDKMEKDDKLNVKIIRLDVDKNSQLATDLKVDGLPTLKLYKSGKVVWEHLGYISEQELNKVFKSKQ